MLAALLRCVLAAVLIAAWDVPARAAGKATVRGAGAVNVREAPDQQSQAIVSLTKGRTVTVEKVVGGWALVTLDSGRRGYVEAGFIALPAGIPVVAAAPVPLPPSPAPSPVPTEAAASVPTGSPETHPEAARRDGLEHEVAQLRERLAALESAVVSTPASGTPAAR